MSKNPSKSGKAKLGAVSPTAMPGAAARGGARFCRNAVDLAAALGLELYEVRLKRGEQLASVKALSERADFPKRSAESGKKGKTKYWLREKIVAWGRLNLKITRNKRVFEPNVGPAIQPPTLNPGTAGSEAGAARDALVAAAGVAPELEIPAAKQPAEGELFSDGPAFERTLDVWEDKLRNPDRWLMSPIQNWQTKRLEKHRPHLFQSPTPGLDAFGTADEFQGGLEAVAAYIQTRFKGVVVNKQDISNWRKCKYLPAGCQEPFPASHNSGRNKKSVIEAWVEKYLKPAATEQGLPLRVDDRSRREKADADLAEMRAGEERKRLSGLYTLTESARCTGLAIGAVARNNCREALERQLPRRMEGAWQWVPDPALREKLMSALRLAAVETFTEWQRQTAAQLGGMVEQIASPTDPGTGTNSEGLKLKAEG